MEWIKVNESLPNVRAAKYRVRRSNGEEQDAFFYEDKMSWIAFYGKKLSHWWNASGNHERLDDVTHWLKIERKSENGMD